MPIKKFASENSNFTIFFTIRYNLQMKKALSLLLVVFSIICLSPNILTAQIDGINPGNIQNLDVNSLSDQQLMNFYRQFQNSGYTIEEVGNIARARGLPPAQVQQLMTRLNEINSAQTGQVDTTGETGTRQGVTGAQLQYSQLPPIEQELLVSELRRLVDERNEEEILQELDLIIEEGFPIFGQNIFAGSSLSFEPSSNVPTPVDYVFGAGDEVQIQIWGAAEAEYSLIINPAGNIIIPDIGPVHIAGLKYDEAKAKIFRNLKQIYSGLNLSNQDQGNTYADVSLGDVRSINVSMICLLYTSPSPRDQRGSRMPSSA